MVGSVIFAPNVSQSQYLKRVKKFSTILVTGLVSGLIAGAVELLFSHRDTLTNRVALLGGVVLFYSC